MGGPAHSLVVGFYGWHTETRASVALEMHRGSLLVAGWSSSVPVPSPCVCAGAKPQLMGLCPHLVLCPCPLYQPDTLKEHCTIRPHAECWISSHCYNEMPETRLLMKRRDLFTPQPRMFKIPKGIMAHLVKSPSCLHDLTGKACRSMLEASRLSPHRNTG